MATDGQWIMAAFITLLEINLKWTDLNPSLMQIVLPGEIRGKAHIHIGWIAVPWEEGVPAPLPFRNDMTYQGTSSIISGMVTRLKRYVAITRTEASSPSHP